MHTYTDHTHTARQRDEHLTEPSHDRTLDRTLDRTITLQAGPINQVGHHCF